MLAVHDAAESLRSRVEKHRGLFISHRNAPDVTVVGGLAGAVDAFAKALEHPHRLLQLAEEQ